MIFVLNAEKHYGLFFNHCFSFHYFHLFINNILMMFKLQISDLPPAPPMHMQPHFQMQMMRFRGGPRGLYYSNTFNLKSIFNNILYLFTDVYERPKA